MYQSEYTQFMRELLASQPELTVERENNRSTWWMRHSNREDQRCWQASSIPQKAYVYQPE